MSKKQLDDANVNAELSGFPVFDWATPKVSILSIGVGVLDSATELVLEAEQQTSKFQPQASRKAEFMRSAYEARLGGGTVSFCHRTPLSSV